MSVEYELGLQTLLAVRTELDLKISDDLLRTCFDIQKKYQFSHDRTLSTQAMDRLIEQYVEKSGEKHTGDGA